MFGVWHAFEAYCCCSGTKSGGLIALAMLVGAPVIEFGIIQELGWWHYPSADKLFGLVGLPSWYGHGGVVPWYTVPPSPARPHLTCKCNAESMRCRCHFKPCSPAGEEAVDLTSFMKMEHCLSLH